MSWSVAIFLVLVQGITCRASHRKQPWNSCSLILLLWETCSGGELSLTAFEAQVLPISSLITDLSGSLFVPTGLLCIDMAMPSGPEGIQNPPVLGQWWPEGGHAKYQDRLIASAGKTTTEMPSLLFLASGVYIYQNAGFQSVWWDFLFACQY